jgi:dienelactone hydrolase
MKVACDHCGKTYSLDSKFEGKRAKCKACGQAFVVRELQPADPGLEDLLPAENAREVFQPAPSYAGSQKPFVPAINSRLVILAASVIVALVGIVTLVALHPWSQWFAGKGKSADKADTLLPDASVSSDTQLVATGGPTGNIGPFSVTLPAGFRLTHREPNPANPRDDMSMALVYGVAEWSGATPSGSACVIGMRVDGRFDDHDTPVPGPTQYLGPGSDELRAAALAKYPHDYVTINDVRYLRVMTDGKPLEYFGYSDKRFVHLTISASGSDSSAADLLESVVRTVKRTISDDDAMAMAMKNSPPAAAVPAERPSLPPRVLPANELLQALAEVLKQYADAHDGLYPTNVYDIFSNGVADQSQFKEEPGSVLIMSPNVPRTKTLPADFVVANVKNIQTGDKVVLFGDGTIRPVSAAEWPDVWRKHINSRGMTDLPSANPGQTLEGGIQFTEVSMVRGRRRPGSAAKLWLYLPPGSHGPKSLPCVFIAPAGSNLMTGNDLGDGDRDEHLPYVKAGFAVVAYELDGIPAARNDRAVLAAIPQFIAVHGGVDDAHAAVDYALTSVPEIDPRRLYVAGHSSAATVALDVAAADPRIKACCAYAPVANLRNRINASVVAIVSPRVPGFDAFLDSASPSQHVDDLKSKPVLLFTADDDDNVPTQSVRDFAASLQQAGGTQIKLVTTATGGHHDSMIAQGIPAGIAFLKEVDAKLAE